MQIFVLLLVVLAIGAMLDPSRNTRSQDVRDQAAAVAVQMSIYHNAAAIQCSPPSPVCPAGRVAVLATNLPPGATMSYGNAGTGYFQSASDGVSEVVTTWLPANIHNAAAQFATGGLVSAAIRQQSGYSVFAGPYNAATQTIGGANLFAYNGQTSTYSVSLPPTFGGMKLTDGYPVLATIVR
jgi:hypothetical protein